MPLTNFRRIHLKKNLCKVHKYFFILIFKEIVPQSRIFHNQINFFLPNMSFWPFYSEIPKWLRIIICLTFFLDPREKMKSVIFILRICLILKSKKMYFHAISYFFLPILTYLGSFYLEDPQNNLKKDYAIRYGLNFSQIVLVYQKWPKPENSVF